MKRSWRWAVVICFITSVAPTWGQVSGARPPILSLAVDRAPVPLEFGLSVKDAEEEYVIDVVPGMVRNAPDSFPLISIREFQWKHGASGRALTAVTRSGVGISTSRPFWAKILRQAIFCFSITAIMSPAS